MEMHTPEPWYQSHRESIGGGMCNTEIYNTEGITIATLSWSAIRGGDGSVTTNRSENARRIVACVNALAGVPTKILERSERVTFPDLPYKDLVQQRDELLDALKLIRGAAQNAVSFRELQVVAAQAITKAEAR